jgi:hypothetical protein
MIEKHLERMIEMFGELPDPIHQPIKFKRLLMVYQYILEREKANGTSS